MSPNSNIFPHREYLTFLFKCWSQHCSGAKYTLEHMLFRSSADWRLLEGKNTNYDLDDTIYQHETVTCSWALPQPSISFELSLQCNLPPPLVKSTNSSTHSNNSTHSLALALSPAPPLGFPALITVCSYKNKTHCEKDVQFWQKMRRYRFIITLSLPLSRSHTHTHTYSKTHTFTVVYKLLQRTLHQLIIITYYHPHQQF